jgi:tetratricopeptide (TPR) repeat protein
LEQKLKQAQDLLRAGDVHQAEAELRPLVSQQPDNPDVLYIAAVCARYLGQFDDALAHVNRLIELVPGHSRAMQELGHLHRDAGRPDDALQAYGMAVQLNPALEVCWREQLRIYLQRNQYGLSSSEQRQMLLVRSQLEYLQNLPKPILAVMDLIAQGKLVKAETLCRDFLKEVPHHIEAMRLLADIGVRMGALDDAEFLLSSAARLKPENLRVRLDYIQTLRKRHKNQQALSEAEALLEDFPGNAQARSLYAVELMQVGEYERAIQLFDEVLAEIPGDPMTLTSRGHALKTRGDQQEAIKSYQSAIESLAHYGEAWYSLANLKTYTFSDEEMALMRQLLEENQSLSAMQRVHLAFALGKAWEDREEYEQSFHYYAQGNRLKKNQSRYSADSIHREFVQQIEICTPELLQKYAGAGFPAEDPIFIVGLPRAGSTLLEQILSSHSLVDGTLELPNVPSLAHRLRRGERLTGDSHYPGVLAELTPEDYREFGEAYIRDTRIHRQGASFFIDKMPNNFRHIGLIKLMLPNAKIIDARRHPLGCCFSGFKQLFAEGQEFSYDLMDIGCYYKDYVALMDHWYDLFPDQILHVQYEELVDDFEAQVRRLLDYCNLPFEEACLNFYKTERAVRTASSEQVRQPINRQGVDQWLNFEPWLGPLKEALGPSLEHFYPQQVRTQGSDHT